MTSILVIDDERTFPTLSGARYCRSSEGGILALVDMVNKYCFHRGPRLDELYLDHDLGETDTIWPVVEYLCTLDEGYKSFVNHIYVHSMNPPGATKICDWLVSSGYYAKRIVLPFSEIIVH